MPIPDITFGVIDLFSVVIWDIIMINFSFGSILFFKVDEGTVHRRLVRVIERPIIITDRR